MPGSGIDLLMGIGGASEGILAAAALKCVGGDFQCQLYAQDDNDIKAIDAAGGSREKVLNIGDLVGDSDVMFAATGVNNSEILNGVRFCQGGAATHSLVLRSRSGTVRFVQTSHTFDREPDYS